MCFFDKPPRYRSYLLTFWEERSHDSGVPTQWRFSLEDPHSGTRRGFATLEAHRRKGYGEALTWAGLAAGRNRRGFSVTLAERSVHIVAMPMVPAVAGPRSEMMSPNRFEATMTSKRCGLSTSWIIKPSMWYWSVLMSG